LSGCGFQPQSFTGLAFDQLRAVSPSNREACCIAKIGPQSRHQKQ
jgi:hypothetical protein